MIKIFLSLLFVTAFIENSSLTFADPPIPRMPLAEIQRRAIENSAALRASAKEFESERIRSEGAGILPNPILTVQGGKEDSSPYTGSTWDITLSQLFPFPGKQATLKRVEKIQADLASVSVESAKLLIQHQVTLAAARVLMLDEIAKHSQERRRRFHIVQNFLRTHPQASPSQKLEAVLIENQIRLLEKGILETDRDKKIADLELNLYLQMPVPPRPVFDWVRVPKSSSIKQLSKDLETKLLENNSEWRMTTLIVERAQEQVNKADLDPWPDVNLSLNYRTENVFPVNNFYSASVGFSLPLWDHGQYSRPSLRANLEKEKLRQDYLKQTLKKRFESAVIRLEASEESLRLFPLSVISSSERKFEEAERQLERGRVTISAFLQIDAQIHETLDSIYQSQLSYLENLSEVLILAGRQMEF